MNIREVRSRKEDCMFFEVARRIYRDDPYWVCPPDSEIRGIFDPERNPAFQEGEAARWIVANSEGLTLGRIAAFIQYNKTKVMDEPIGGVGFFESVNDASVSRALFDTAKEWLQAKGMVGMDGPINFGENDTFWGLLVEGFSNPAYGMNYHLPYYEGLFRDYGFGVYFEQISSIIHLDKPFPERFWKIASRVTANPAYRFEAFRFNKKQQFANDFAEVYNDAWQFHEGFIPMDASKVLANLEKSRAILDGDLVWFAYAGKEPIGFIVLLPDLNQAIKSFNGRLGWWQKIQFMGWTRRRISRAMVVIIGVKPAWQQFGIESAMLRKLREVFDTKPMYREIEVSWVGDFNPKMRALQEATGAVQARKHLTMRKYFQEGRMPEPPKTIPVNSKDLFRKKFDPRDKKEPQGFAG